MSDDPVPPTENINATEQPLLAHLLELRQRLLWCVGVVLLVFLGLAYFATDLFHYLSAPLLRYLPNGTGMLATEVIAPFTAPFKLAFVAAIFLCVPFLLYQVWAFIAPGLYQREKRIAMPLLASSVLLFYAGVAFAYYFVFPVMFGFMSRILPEGVTYAPDISRYLDVVLGMFVAFGFTFEIPVATVLLVLMGVTSSAALVEKRSWIIVCCFIIAAVLTPPDALSQLMLAIPMCLLFETGIFFSRLVERRDDSAT
ncbi:MAG TPA: twin-arginine translocase subunit TatC [Pseudomonadales bacterium]|nr:twin-arginine translocase subunit TatC [Pseudomonadales bacterium]HRG50645.1 twin-arginine translocase subunit TatC [Pseudomonadales bacterium]